MELEDINVVRLCMKVCTISDITTADRKRYDWAYLMVKRTLIALAQPFTNGRM